MLVLTVVKRKKETNLVGNKKKIILFSYILPIAIFLFFLSLKYIQSNTAEKCIRNHFSVQVRYWYFNLILRWLMEPMMIDVLLVDVLPSIPSLYLFNITDISSLLL